MEGLGVTDFWRGKRVLVTGHTGFKGGWLSLWLTQMGAEVFGYALAPDTQPALFAQLELENAMDHVVSDVRDAETLRTRVRTSRPDVIFHLAAQPLVRRSYREPLSTWDINVMGTANLLNALRDIEHRCATIIVTTDKVYENREWAFAYREVDRLGGHDPYSASKAATELLVSSFRASFFSPQAAVRIATARAGNVIGGGDWAEDRIVPDLVRALGAGEPIPVRNSRAVRPWQHVLEPLGGYLRLAERLYLEEGDQLSTGFNFGPEPRDFRSVRELVETALGHWPGAWRDASDPTAPHEANLLSLTIEKARAELNWSPRWGFDQAVARTLQWYRAVHDGQSAREITLTQIEAFGAP